ncbi:MAG: GGDEF domain-containing protein [Nitriliruptoraceae bacterium]
MDLYGTWRGRRIDVVVLVLLYLGGFVLCTMVALFPVSEGTPVRFAQFCAVVALFGAGTMWLAGVRWPSAVVHLGLAIHIIATAGFIARTADPRGAMTTTFAFIWVALYVAAFRQLSVARIYLAIILVFLGAGLVAHPQITGQFAFNSWFVPGLTTVAGTEVLGRLVRRLRSLTTVDRLTGAYNRIGFDVITEQVRAGARRRGGVTTLALIDLDEFKQINDDKGHAAGDEVLRALVRTWRQAARPDDVICRYGGDEFVVLMPDTEPDEAEVLLDRLHKISAVSWTAGVAVLDADEPVATALDRADRQMYERKQGAGRLRSLG